MKKNNHITKKVKADYNRISNHFSSTRFSEWPEMTHFASYVKNDWRILDLGCGNGRLLESLKGKDIDYLGIDISEKLLEIAKNKYSKANFKKMNMTDLAFEKNIYDAVFAIASLHHISSKEARVKAITEATRVLKTNGYFFITVWDLWQPKYRPYIWKNLLNMILERSGTHFGDTFIPWKSPNKEILAKRYYYAYTLTTLKKDLCLAGLNIEKMSKSKWNIWAICKKS